MRIQSSEIINPFAEKYLTDSSDEILVDRAVQGSRKALEELIYRHQAWIYNIALRMVWNPQDAKDVTQEILIKVITKLSTFKKRSSFRTWVYRITANHVINMKTRKYEKFYRSFSQYGRSIDDTADMEIPDRASLPVDVSLVVEETKIGCMFGMLLCLDREQRLIFILGEVLNVTDKIGAEILKVSRVNFRKKLSRARQDIRNFMDHKCGLVKKINPCHCTKKTRALIDEGVVVPERLLFSKNYVHKIGQVVGEKYRQADNFFESKHRQLFRDHPFQTPPDFVHSLTAMLDDPEFREIFNFNN